MDETIGVKGGHNDRLRTIKNIDNKKQEEFKEEEYIKELEKEVKKKRRLSLIKTIPVVVAGQTFVTLYKGGTAESKDEEKSKWNIKEYDADFTTKERINDNKSGANKEEKSKVNTETKVIVDKDTGRKYVVEVPVREEKKKTIIEEILYPIEIVVNGDKSSEESKYSDELLEKDDYIFIDDNSYIDISTLSDDNKKILEDLKSKKIVDYYEKQLKDLRYDLRKLVFEYEVINNESERVVLKEECEILLDKLTVVIGKIEELKNKIKIDDLDKYDDNYIYVLIEKYLDEFKNNKVISEIKDSSLYILISNKIDELDKKKDKLEDKLNHKKDELDVKEKKFEDLVNSYYSIDKFNDELNKFQLEQERLLAELKEKVNNSLTITEKVKMEFEYINKQNSRLKRLMGLSLLMPGPKFAKGMAFTSASYLYFLNKIFNSKAANKKYKVVNVEDYSDEIKNNIGLIEDASSSLYKNINQIDKMLDRIYSEFKDYIDVIPECKNVINGLIDVKNQLKEKEYEMEKIKEEQRKVLENNNAKVLKRGEYAA